MSAAAKLRALMEARDGYFDVGHSSDFSLVFALPQIVALVEAVEKTLRAGEEPPSRALATNLAALDEALS